MFRICKLLLRQRSAKIIQNFAARYSDKPGSNDSDDICDLLKSKDICDLLKPKKETDNCDVLPKDTKENEKAAPVSQKGPNDSGRKASGTKDSGSMAAGSKDSGTKDSGPSVIIKLKNTFKLHLLESEPATTVRLTKHEATVFYKQMQTIRRMENAAAALYREKVIRGFCHLYSGQEAVCVGVKAAMRPQDHIITAYRCHGWTYVMGTSVQAVLTELTGRKGGVQRGKGGSMHMYSQNYYGGNGIVGAQMPVGAGVALSCKYRGDKGVCMALHGDGAANQGQLWEAYNMACLWKLPCIFAVENNQFGMGTSVERSSCDVDYYQRVSVIPGLWVDGMNVVAVRSAAEFAFDYAMKNGPIIVDFDTYRYGGHSMSDPGTSYRKREVIEEIRTKRDPITSFQALCIQGELLTEAEFTAMDNEIKKEVNDAVEFSKKDAEIELKELTADVYSQNLEPKIRGTTGFSLPHIQINKGVNH